VRNATQLLSELQQGDAEAANQLLNLIQTELRQIAGRLWGDWPAQQTLQPTLLVNMAWERLVGFEGDFKKIVPTTLLAGDLKDLPAFTLKLFRQADPVSRFIHQTLSDPTRQTLAAAHEAGQYPSELQVALIHGLNAIIKGPSIYETARFATVALRPETRELLERKPDAVRGCGRLNRLLLEDAYPADLSRELHKEQFLRFAAVTMKRILWEARERKKGRPPMAGSDALENVDVAGADEPADRLILVQDAVDQLAAAHPQAGQIVKLVCYEGKTIPEAAREMQITLITAKRRWEFAKAWLYKKVRIF